MTKYIMCVVFSLFILFMFTPKNIISWAYVKFCEIKSMIDFKKVKIVIYATVFFMFVAYMYAWINGSFLCDASFIYRGTPGITVSDKWLAWMVWIIDAGVNEPWLAGLIATILMVISVYCIVDILEINKNWAICLVAGLCSTNSVIICQQEYAGGNYTGEIALVLACISMWIIKNIKCKVGIKTLIVALTIACSAGIYGAYVSIVPSLMLIVLFMDIFKGVEWKKIWSKAFLYLFYFVTGMVLYYAILRGLMYVTGGQLSAYMGEDNLESVSGVLNMIKTIPAAYISLKHYYINGLTYLPGFMAMLLKIIMLTGGALTLYWCYSKRKEIKRNIMNFILLILIILLLPLAINLIQVMSSGYVHYLMIFTYVVPVLFFVKIMENIISVEEYRKIWIRLSMFLGAVMSVYLYYSVVMANAVYVDLYNKYEVSLETGAKILDRIETCEGYEGNEQVVLVGRLSENPYYGEAGQEADILNAFLGNNNPNYSNILVHGLYLEWFLVNILDSKIEYSYYDTLNICIANEGEQYADVLEEMESFPRKDCVIKVEDKIFVKLSE